MAIGIDFDNTIACYDRLFHQEALEEGLIDPACASFKQTVRDAVRSHHGDVVWQKLQGRVYGPGMCRAEVMPGFLDFLDRARQHGMELYVISHKTEYSPHDQTRTNLRRAALEWMETQGLFNDRKGLLPEHVFFESTRESKVMRINDVGCTHFIDDLEEVLLHPNLAPKTHTVLYAPQGCPEFSQGRFSCVCASWQEISRYVFGS
jgi:hypothetical protein